MGYRILRGKCSDLGASRCDLVGVVYAPSQQGQLGFVCVFGVFRKCVFFIVFCRQKGRRGFPMQRISLVSEVAEGRPLACVVPLDLVRVPS